MSLSGAVEKRSWLFHLDAIDRIALTNIIGRCPQPSEMTIVAVGSVSPHRALREFNPTAQDAMVLFPICKDHWWNLSRWRPNDDPRQTIPG